MHTLPTIRTESITGWNFCAAGDTCLSEGLGLRLYSGGRDLRAQ